MRINVPLLVMAMVVPAAGLHAQTMVLPPAVVPSPPAAVPPAPAVTAALEAPEQPRVVCGMTLVPADPSVDPGIGARAPVAPRVQLPDRPSLMPGAPALPPRGAV